MRTRRVPNDLGNHADAHRRQAVVVGGSMAGFLAARVLSDHFGQVIVLERDHYPETPSARKGLPQARHVHGLLDRGRRILERLLPGLTGELIAAGAAMHDGVADIANLSRFGWLDRSPSDIVLLAATRDLIDWCIRRRVAALPNVQVRQAVDVLGLAASTSGQGVDGVRLRRRGGASGVEEELAADLVVVADGRGSRLPGWLAALGYAPPEETVVNAFLGYSSRFYQPPRDFRPGWKFLYVNQAPPDDPRGGVIFPVEGGRWLVTLMGGDGDTPPTDEAGFLDFARSLRSPDVFEAIRDAEPLTPIACQRKIENRLRHYDRLGRSPEGLIVLGDAACAFNPVYGQGMTAAALGAEVLGRWLRRPPGAPGSCRRFQRDLARSIAAPWLLSTGADYRFKTTVGPTPGPASRWVQGYIDELFRLSTRHAGARRRMAGVFHLLRPPSALFGPDIMGPLVWNRLMRRSPAGWTAPEGPVGAIAGLHDAGNGSIPSRVEGR